MAISVLRIAAASSFALSSSSFVITETKDGELRPKQNSHVPLIL